MNVKKTLDEFFKEYGSPFTEEGKEQFNGILSKKSPYGENDLTDLGQTADDTFYLYFSSDTESVKKGSVLKSGGESYLVYYCRSFFLSGTELYKTAYLKDITEGRGIYEQY